jgi:hypothetical protein
VDVKVENISPEDMVALPDQPLHRSMIALGSLIK